VADSDCIAAAPLDPNADDELIEEAFPGAIAFAAMHNAAADEAAASSTELLTALDMDKADDELAASLLEDFDPAAEMDAIGCRAEPADDELQREAERAATPAGAVSDSAAAVLIHAKTSSATAEFLEDGATADAELDLEGEHQVLASVRDASGARTVLFNELPRAVMRGVSPARVPVASRRGVAFAPQGAA
jgi:hypothetical protein